MNSFRKILFALLMVQASFICAQTNMLVVSATIDPEDFYIDSSIAQEVFTVITWNDATAIDSVYMDIWGYIFLLEEGIDYTLTDHTGETSKMIFNSEEARSIAPNSDDNVYITIFFDCGNPAVFTIHPEIEPMLYGVQFWVNDINGQAIEDAILCFYGVTHAPGDYFAGFFEAGTYNFSFTREGFLPYESTIDVWNPISDVIILDFDPATLISPKQQAELSVFPNPCKSQLNVQLPQNIVAAKVELIDLQGNIILSKTVLPYTEKLQLKIESLTAGCYLLKHSSAHINQMLLVIKK